MTDRMSARKPRIAAVMDAFTHETFSHDAEIEQMHPARWREQLTAFCPDLLFLESAWHGLDDAWRDKLAMPNRPPSYEVADMIAFCQDMGVPTVFWNKEDPYGYGRFFGTARLADHVFTADSRSVGRYCRDLGHGRVHALPFAGQPRMHNPVETHVRKEAVHFAGAYYPHFKHRVHDLETMVQTLSPLLPFEIYDRYANDDFGRYKFPSRYARYIKGHAEYSEMGEIYKRYRYGITLNSIKTSPTMFARRVFELLLSNTLTFSNLSRGVRLLFGDIVLCSGHASDMIAGLERWRNDENYARWTRLLGLRKVMSEHTCGKRLRFVCSVAGVPLEGQADPLIYLLAKTDNVEQARRIAGCCARQSYENRRLLLVAPPGVAGDLPLPPGTRVFGASEDAVRFLERARSPAMLALLDQSDHYGPNYLLDLKHAFEYSNARAVGKYSRYVVDAGDDSFRLVHDGRQYRYTDSLSMRSCLFSLDSQSLQSVYRHLENGAGELRDGVLLAVDEFHYIENGARLSDAQKAAVEDPGDINTGLPLDLAAADTGPEDPDPYVLSAPPLFDGGVAEAAPISVAIDMSGLGLGDEIISLAWLLELLKSVPEALRIVVYNSKRAKNAEFLTHNNGFVRMVNEPLSDGHAHDLVFSVHYFVKPVQYDLMLIAQKSPRLAVIVQTCFVFNEQWNVFSRGKSTSYGRWADTCIENGWDRWSSLGASGAVLFSAEQRLPVFLDASAVSVLDRYGLRNKKYITMHRGIDAAASVENTDALVKVWPRENAEEFCRVFTREYPDIPIVLLGVQDRLSLANATLNLIGKTTLQEAAVLLKYSSAHLDGESGFVHLRRQLGGESVVLFGPTPAGFFGYKENINLTSDYCSGCMWWATGWHVNCRRGLGRPGCLARISAGEALDAVAGQLAARGEQRFALANDALFSEEFAPRMVRTMEAVREASLCREELEKIHNDFNKQWDYAYVDEQLETMARANAKAAVVSRDWHSLPAYLSGKGYGVTVFDSAYGVHDPRGTATLGSISRAAAKGGYALQLGDSKNIPVQSGLFDVAVYHVTEDDKNELSRAIEELIRIVADGGMIVLTGTIDIGFDKGTPYDALALSIQEVCGIRLTIDENDLPDNFTEMLKYFHPKNKFKTFCVLYGISIKKLKIL